MKAQYFIALLVALALGAGTIYIYRHPDNLRDQYYALSKKCALDKKFCVALLSPLKALSDTAFEIKRKQLSLERLPILRIYMSDGALKKLQDKRTSTLVGKLPILLNEDDDWVKATLLSDDGKGTRKARARIRLKGDWADHLRNSQKLSFRIKVRNKDKIFGMSKFSIQAPGTRNYNTEPLLLDMMRKVGVFAPRYFYVDVRINDMKIGIMALEEHFTKLLVESQGGREGPIVAFDEDLIWRQRHLNVINEQSGLPYKYRDLPIKIFKAGQFKPGTVRTQQNMRAMSLLRDFMDGTASATEVFDIDKVSRWWIITNIWNGLHGAITHNLRFYFSPVSGLLEPISFDNGARPRENERLINNIATGALISDVNFRYVTLNNLDEITKIITSSEYEKEYNRRQKEYLDILAIDGTNIEKLSLSELRLNLADTIRKIEKKYTSPTAIAAPAVKKENRIRKNDPVKFISILKKNGQLYTHLRSFVYWYPDHAELEFKNLTMNPVLIQAVYFSADPDKNLWTGDQTVPVYNEKNNGHIQMQSIDNSEHNFNNKLMVRYKYLNKIYTKPVVLQFRDSNTGYVDQDTAREWYKEQGVVIKKNGKTLLFPPGKYLLDKNIEVKNYWKLVLLPGAELDLIDGAILKVRGPIYSLGTEEIPVKINIQSSADKGSLGSWGGILVQQSSRKSYLNHTIVTGNSIPRLPERQDSSGLTGCITFYQSNVQIKQSKFTNLQCEDALNIISSNFTIDNVTIDGSSADAFDSDFSNGSISDSTFTHIGNDGVDLSGSNVKIYSSRFTDINDKAISVGEASQLSAKNIEITTAKSGIVSKDNSIVNIENAYFKNIDGSALFAYVKKQEYGPSELNCTGCTFENTESPAAEQFGSKITIDGKDLETTPFSRKQLRAADYIR